MTVKNSMTGTAHKIMLGMFFSMLCMLSKGILSAPNKGMIVARRERVLIPLITGFFNLGLPMELIR